jgi:hypothetical protein
LDVIYFRCRLQNMYNLHYVPTTLGVQSWREIISGGMRTKKVEYHSYRSLWAFVNMVIIKKIEIINIYSIYIYIFFDTWTQSVLTLRKFALMNVYNEEHTVRLARHPNANSLIWNIPTPSLINFDLPESPSKSPPNITLPPEDDAEYPNDSDAPPPSNPTINLSIPIKWRFNSQQCPWIT